MVSINPAFQVLVPSANSAAIAAGSTVDQLAPGQIGFFSYTTNLAIDGTDPSQSKSFYVAVGVDRLAAGTIQDVNKSAGATIERKGIRAFTYKPYQAPKDKVILLNVGAVQCSTDYAIKFDIRSALVYANYGFNTPSKTFTASSDPCTDACVDCAAGSPSSVAIGLANAINLDEDGILVADLLLGGVGVVTLTPSASGGTMAAGAKYYKVTSVNAQGESLGSAEVTTTTTGTTGSVALAWTAVPGATGYKVYRGTTAGAESVYFATATNSLTDTGAAGTAGTVPTVSTATVPAASASGVATQIRITVSPLALTAYSFVNLNYLNPRQVNVYLSLLSNGEAHGAGNFGPDTTQSTFQEIVYQDGSGYDINQLEYIAGGWNGKPGPYRTSELVGMPIAGYEAFAVPASTYSVYSLTYENTGIGGGHKYQTSLLTIIAVPSGNSTALASINAILNRIVNDLTSNNATVNAAYPVANQEVESFE